MQLLWTTVVQTNTYVILRKKDPLLKIYTLVKDICMTWNQKDAIQLIIKSEIKAPLLGLYKLLLVLRLGWRICLNPLLCCRSGKEKTVCFHLNHRFYWCKLSWHRVEIWLTFTFKACSNMPKLLFISGPTFSACKDYCAKHGDMPHGGDMPTQCFAVLTLIFINIILM